MPDTDKTVDNDVQGERVPLIWTDDDATQLQPGDHSTVEFVDDLHTGRMRSNAGSHLGMDSTFGDKLRHLSAAELAEEHAGGEAPCPQ